jgi:hypothetical protein
MDKTMFRGYVRELVREAVQEEVKKLLPKLLDEAINEVKSLQENASTPASVTKPKLDRARLASMMGLERQGDTFTASTNRAGPVMAAPPPGVTPDNPAFQAINKDYSAMMKAMKLV